MTTQMKPMPTPWKQWSRDMWERAYTIGDRTIIGTVLINGRFKLGHNLTYAAFIGEGGEGDSTTLKRFEGRGALMKAMAACDQMARDEIAAIAEGRA